MYTCGGTLSWPRTRWTVAAATYLRFAAIPLPSLPQIDSQVIWSVRLGSAHSTIVILATDLCELLALPLPPRVSTYLPHSLSQLSLPVPKQLRRAEWPESCRVFENSHGSYIAIHEWDNSGCSISGRSLLKFLQCWQQ